MNLLLFGGSDGAVQAGHYGGMKAMNHLLNFLEGFRLIGSSPRKRNYIQKYWGFKQDAANLAGDARAVAYGVRGATEAAYEQHGKAHSGQSAERQGTPSSGYTARQ